MKVPRTHGIPVVLTECVKLANGARGEIRVHHGRDGYGATLVMERTGLRMPIVTAKTETAAETLRAAKKYLGSVYGRSN